MSEAKGKLQKIANLQKMMEKIDKDITDREQTFGIKDLREERSKLSKEYDKELKAVISAVKFSPDRFLASRGSNADSYREGPTKLIRSSRTVRSIMRGAFVRDHKDLALKICTIPVGEAEKALGAELLERYCSRKTTYSYDLEIYNVE